MSSRIYFLFLTLVFIFLLLFYCGTEDVQEPTSNLSTTSILSSSLSSSSSTCKAWEYTSIIKLAYTIDGTNWEITQPWSKVYLRPSINPLPFNYQFLIKKDGTKCIIHADGSWEPIQYTYQEVGTSTWTTEQIKPIWGEHHIVESTTGNINMLFFPYGTQQPVICKEDDNFQNEEIVPMENGDDVASVYFYLDSSDEQRVLYCDEHYSSGQYSYGLKYIESNGTGWEITTLKEPSDGYFFCGKIDNLDRFQFIMYDRDDNKKKYCTLIDGSNWSCEDITDIIPVDCFSPMVLDKNNYPHFLIYKDDVQPLKYAHHDGTSWTVTDTGIIIPNKCNGISMIRDMSSGKMHAVFYTYYDDGNCNTIYDVHYLHYNGISWVKVSSFQAITDYTCDGRWFEKSFGGIQKSSDGTIYVSFLEHHIEYVTVE